MKRKKRRPGQPSHKPTAQGRQVVEVMTGYGVPQEQIAQVLHISRPTLLKHYAREIECGTGKVQGMLVGNLARLAKGSDGTALKAIMFSLQTRFGWSQYAPAPAEPKPKPLGKKEEADIQARTAHEDTEWSSLLH